MSDSNAGIIEEFRANDGRVGGIFEGRMLLILHTTGARSGVTRLIPLQFRQEGDRRFVFASKNGAHSHPDWLYNLRANGGVTVEAPGETYDATATELPEDERQMVYQRQSEEYPNFAEYAVGTSRLIPVLELVRA